MFSGEGRAGSEEKREKGLCIMNCALCIILNCLNKYLVHAWKLLVNACEGVVLVEVSNGVVQGGASRQLDEGAVDFVARHYVKESFLRFNLLLTSHVHHKEVLLVLLLNVGNTAFKHHTGVVDKCDLLTNLLHARHHEQQTPTQPRLGDGNSCQSFHSVWQ